MIFRFNSESKSDEDEHPGTADERDAQDDSLQVHDHTDYDIFQSDNNDNDDDDDDDDNGSRSGDVYEPLQYDREENESEENEDDRSLLQQSDRLASLHDVSDSHLNGSVADSDITSSPATLSQNEQHTSGTFTNPATVPVQYDMLMREVQKSNELIKGLYDRLKKTEDKVKDIDFRVSRKGKRPAQKTPIPDDVKVGNT